MLRVSGNIPIPAATRVYHEHEAFQPAMYWPPEDTCMRLSVDTVISRLRPPQAQERMGKAQNMVVFVGKTGMSVSEIWVTG